MWSEKHFNRQMKRVEREKRQCDKEKELYDKRLEVKMVKRSMRSFKLPTTTKIIMAFLLINCTAVEVYSMVVMWKLQNLDALYSLITAVITESISFAVYAAKSYNETTKSSRSPSRKRQRLRGARRRGFWSAGRRSSPRAGLPGRMFSAGTGTWRS